MSKVSDYSESSMKSWSISEIETRYKPNEGSSYKGNVGAGWVLKDRTESTNNGITEIRFKFGLSNNWHFVNFIPFFGQATSVIIASINASLPWRSAYFDHDTGIFLSNDLNSARRKQYDIRIGEAEGLLEKGEFVAAHNKFAQAWRDSNDSSIKDKLKNCLDSTKLAAEGQSLFDSGEFSEAASKFRAACLLSNVSKIYSKFSNSLAVANIAAKAQTLLNSGEFSEAAAKFQAAYLLSNVSKISSKFYKSLAAANIAAEAQTLLKDDIEEVDVEEQESDGEVEGNLAEPVIDVLGGHSVGEVEFTTE